MHNSPARRWRRSIMLPASPRVVVPWLVVGLLVRGQAEKKENPWGSLTKLVPHQQAQNKSKLVPHQQAQNKSKLVPHLSSTSGPRTCPPLTMHAAVCSALGRQLSLSDSALLGNKKTSRTSRRTQTSPSSPSLFPSPTTRTSPVFARMLANTREPPATPQVPRHKLDRDADSARRTVNTLNTVVQQ
jgi:hypothetical protein